MSVNRIIPITLVALALGGLAAGCGSAVRETATEPAANPPTRAEWATQANAICARKNDELEALNADVPTQVEEIGFEAFLRKVLAAEERSLAGLREVPAPPADAAKIDDLLELQAEADASYASAIPKLVAGREKSAFRLLAVYNELGLQSARMAADLGAEDCTESYSVDDLSSADASAHLLTDDFSDPSRSVWQREGDRGTGVTFDRGAARISVPVRGGVASTAAIFPEARDRVGIAADVKQLRSDHAPEVAVIGCIAGAGPGTGYDFAVDPDIGYYAIMKVSARGVRVLREGQSDVVRGLREVNHVQGECSSGGSGRPTTLRLFVNGERLLTLRDAKGLCNFVGVGLLVYSEAGGTTAEFDNVVADAL